MTHQPVTHDLTNSLVNSLHQTPWKTRDKCNQKRVCLSTLINITFTCIFTYPIHLYVCLPLEAYLLHVFSWTLYAFFSPQMLLILCLTAYYLSTQVILVAHSLTPLRVTIQKKNPANNENILAKKQTNQPNTSGSWRFLGKSLVSKRPLRAPISLLAHLHNWRKKQGSPHLWP